MDPRHFWYHNRHRVQPPRGALRLMIEKRYSQVSEEHSEAVRKLQARRPTQYVQTLFSELPLPVQKALSALWKAKSQVRILEDELQQLAPTIGVHHSLVCESEYVTQTRPSDEYRALEGAWQDEWRALQKQYEARIDTLVEVVHELEEVKLKAVRQQVPEELQRKLENA